MEWAFQNSVHCHREAGGGGLTATTHPETPMKLFSLVLAGTSALLVLHGGETARNAGQPSEIVFVRAVTDGGRMLMDLGNVISMRQVNTCL